MRICRDTSAADLAALRAYLKTRPEVKAAIRADYFAYFMLAAFIGFGVLAIPLARWTANAPLWFLASPFIGALVWHPIWVLLDKWALGRFVAANRLELGLQEFWITEDGFGNSTPAGSAFHRWPAVKAADSTPALGYVAAGVHVYAIPSAGHPEEVESFIGELRRRWDAASGRRTGA